MINKVTTQTKGFDLFTGAGMNGKDYGDMFGYFCQGIDNPEKSIFIVYIARAVKG
jgi:hypothetical protein